MVVGPTASGKSELAMGVARMVGDAEIVTLDSMQVYRGMDIGTATPGVAEQAEVAHHLIDLVDPSEEFAVAELQARARAVIDDICETAAQYRSWWAAPACTCGPLIDGLRIPGRFPDVRSELDVEPDTAALHRRLVAISIRSPPAAWSRPTGAEIVRALEVTIGSGQLFSSYGPGLDHYPTTPFVQVGLCWERDRLDGRIAARYQRQLAGGFLGEVKALAGRPISRTAAQALGYKELLTHVRGEATLDEALDLAVTRTRRFARRQERWFRRDPRIHWLDAPAAPTDVLSTWKRATAGALPTQRPSG